MARRTKKQQKKVDAGVKLLLLISAFSSYYLSKDIFITALIVILVIIIMIGFTIFQTQKEKARLRNSGIEDIDTMDGIQFEHYLRVLYSAHGYKVEVTKATGDFGADLILHKDGKKIVVQAKRYTKNVGIKAVQEIIAAKNYYHASDAWVVSNSNYTNAAVELADVNDVMLVNRKKLIDSILKMNPDILPSENKIKTDASKNICDRCGGKMILRTGRRGDFYGCSKYPRCRNTKDMTN